MAGSSLPPVRKTGSFKRLQGIAGTGGLNQGTGNANGRTSVSSSGSMREAPGTRRPVTGTSTPQPAVVGTPAAPRKIEYGGYQSADAIQSKRPEGDYSSWQATQAPQQNMQMHPSVHATAGSGMARNLNEKRGGDRTGVEVIGAGGTPVRIDNNQQIAGAATEEQARQTRTVDRNSIYYDRQQDPDQVVGDVTRLSALRRDRLSPDITDQERNHIEVQIKELEQGLEQSYQKDPRLKELAAQTEAPLNTNIVDSEYAKMEAESKVYAEKRQARVDKLYSDIAQQEKILAAGLQNMDPGAVQAASRALEDLKAELKGMGGGTPSTTGQQSTSQALTSSSGGSDIATSGSGLTPEQEKASGTTATPGAGATFVGGQKYYDKLPLEGKQAADDLAAINAEQQKAHDAGDSRRFYDLQKTYDEAEARYLAAGGTRKLRAFTDMPITEDTGQTTTLDGFKSDIPTYQSDDAEAIATAERKARMAEYQKLVDEPYDTYAIERQYDQNIEAARQSAARNKALALRGMQERGAYSGASVNQMMGQNTEAGYGYDVAAQQEEAKLGLSKAVAVQQSLMQQTQNKINAAQAALSIAANAEEAAKARAHVAMLQAQQTKDQAKLMELQQEMNTPSTGMQIAGLGIQAVGAIGALYTGGASMVAANAINNQIQGSAPGTQAAASNFNYTSAPGTTDSWNTGRSGNASVRLS